MTSPSSFARRFLPFLSLLLVTSPAHPAQDLPVMRLDERGGPAPGSAPCTPPPSATVTQGRRPGATIDPCGRILWDPFRGGTLGTLEPRAASSDSDVVIDSMQVLATTFGYYENYYPGGELNLIAHTYVYYLSDGTSWLSGAGYFFISRATLNHVEASGETLRYVLNPPPDGVLYRQTDFNSGEHSSQGEMAVVGPLVIEALRGSKTATLRGRARITSNDATFYGEPRFNYFAAPVGSIVPYRMTYQLASGGSPDSTGGFTDSTFAAPFSYNGSGTVSFVQDVTLPPLIGLEVRGPRKVQDESSTQYKAIGEYEFGTHRDLTDLASWTVEPSSLATITHGNLTVGALSAPETLYVTAHYDDGEAYVQDDIVIVARPDAGDGSGSWPMYQADHHHTGSLPLSIDVDRISFLWQRSVAPGGFPLNPVAAADGRVFCSTLTYFGSTTQLFALDAATGNTEWSKYFGSVFSVNPPSFALGAVYVQTGNHMSDTWLHALDAETGEEIFRSPHGAQWERYYAPTIDAGKVYVDGGEYGGMYAFDAFSGEQLWFHPLPQYDQWTPALDETYAYAYVGAYEPALYALRRSDGEEEFRIPDPEFEWDGWSMNLAPVVGSMNDVLAIHDGRLISFDVAARNIRWQLRRNFTGQPSVSGGVVYAIDGGLLMAIDELTGDILWQWLAGESLAGTLIVTGSHLFVCSNSYVYALDLGIHLAVWSAPASGHLAIGNGALYVASPNGRLWAFDLGLAPPIAADAGDDATVECAGAAGTPVRLDGTRSQGEGLYYVWSADGVTFDDDASPTPTGTFPLGLTRVVLEVSLGLETDRDTVEITVRDSAPPAVQLSVEPAMLWPPDHAMIPVRVTASASDGCDASPAIRLVGIAGGAEEDVAGASYGEPDFEFSLRAAREGPSEGRTYLLEYEAVDGSGHSTSGTTMVLVPHAQGRAGVSSDATPRLTLYGSDDMPASQIDPASIAVGSWTTDYGKVSLETGVTADVNGDGRADRTWLLESIGGGMPSGTTLYARWRAGSLGFYAPLEGSWVADVGSERASLAIRAQANPSFGRAHLDFQLPTEGWTRVRVYDLNGRVLATLAEGWMTSGRHQVTYDPGSGSGQVVFYQLEWQGQKREGQLILLR